MSTPPLFGPYVPLKILAVDQGSLEGPAGSVVLALSRAMTTTEKGLVQQHPQYSVAGGNGDQLRTKLSLDEVEADPQSLTEFVAKLEADAKAKDAEEQERQRQRDVEFDADVKRRKAQAARIKFD